MKLKLLLGALAFTAITAKAQVSFINENFDSFVNAGDGSLPQNGWTTQIPVTDPSVAPRLSVEAPGLADKYIQAYSLFSANTAFYLISPQIVAPTGGQTLSITTLRIGGAPGSGSVEIGLVASPTDMSTFTSLGSPIPMTTSSPTVTTVNVPASGYQYIAFKFLASANHQALRLDNVILSSAAGSLGVHETTKTTEEIKFAVNSDNTALQFVSKKEPKNIQIYSAAGQKTAEGKINRQQFDISNLQTGLYYTIVETADGKTIKSKFIKK
ncbi:T9SS type A sorting domain-containing protein [Chryseobacterium sp. PMSZPI]|uniref:T9SS type A sorting domain-containing protein n=1 Tax=Chryseobacterium sp. PMSZPI TaxID=1033900 RepID=UPI0039A3CC4C